MQRDDLNLASADPSHEPCPQEEQIQSGREENPYNQDTTKSLFKDIIAKVNKKIMATPISDRKIRELEPTSLTSRLKGRYLSTLMHNYSDAQKNLDLSPR